MKTGTRLSVVRMCEVAGVLAAAGEGAILAGQWGPHRHCRVAVDWAPAGRNWFQKETMFTDRRKAHSRPWWGEKEDALSGEPAGIRSLR